MRRARSYFQKLFIILAIFIITFLPVVTPTVYAVSSWTGNSWTGNSWEGNPWQGNPWDGSDLTWKGNSWNGQDWSGNEFAGDVTNSNISWSLEPWMGHDWSSNGFQGNDFSGMPWSQDGYSGNSFNGTPWMQNGYSGNSFNGTPWMQNGYSGNSFNGNPWMQNSYSGNSFNGNPWMQNGYNGNSFNGNPWMQNGYNGNSFNGSPYMQNGYNGNFFSGNAWDRYRANTAMNSYNYSNSNPQRFYDSKGYKITEFIAKDFIGSSAQMAVGGMEHMRHMDAGKNYNWDYGSRFYSDMLVGGFKVAGVDNGVTQTYDAASKMWDGVEGYNQFRGRPDILNSFRSSIDDSIIPTLGSKKNILNKLIPPAPVQKVLSKLSVPGAALGAVSSGGKIIDSSFEAFKAWNSDSSTAEKAVSTASAGENVGDFLMSAGAITAAIPGGQAAGGILAAAGAGIWAVSKGVKWYAKNSEKINKGIKKAGKAVVDGASKAWNFTKGLFS